MALDQDLIIIVSVFSCAVAVLLIIALVLCVQVSSLRKKVAEMQANGRMKIQKLKLKDDKNHAFHNPALVPDEELSRRGYSMYMGDNDVESGRHERQTGGQFVERETGCRLTDLQTSHFIEDKLPNGHFVDELTRELDHRHQRPNNAPPFLLHSIQDSKRKTRSLTNPHASGRQSDTNPNFIY